MAAPISWPRFFNNPGMVENSKAIPVMNEATPRSVSGSCPPHPFDDGDPRFLSPNISSHVRQTGCPLFRLFMQRG